MRHRVQQIGLIALAGTLVVSASALAASPEFFKGGVALAPGQAVKYSAKNAGSVINNIGGISKITCMGGTAAGETNGPTEIQNLVITFTGCENQLTAGCNSRGSGAGEIKTETLKGQLGYLVKAGGKPAGLSYEPVNAGRIFLEYKCAALVPFTRVTGMALGEVPKTPKSKTWEAIFSPNIAGTAEKFVQFEEKGGLLELKAGCSTVTLKLKEEMTWAGGAELEINGS
jgi:hypothetical protein